MNRHLLLTCLAGAVLAVSCGGNDTANSPSPVPSVSSGGAGSSSLTASSTTTSSAATSRPGRVTKTFLLTINGTIPSGDSFQLYFDTQASPNIFPFCGQTGPP